MSYDDPNINTIEEFDQALSVCEKNLTKLLGTTITREIANSDKVRYAFSYNDNEQNKKISEEIDALTSINRQVVAFLSTTNIDSELQTKLSADQLGKFKELFERYVQANDTNIFVSANELCSQAKRGVIPNIGKYGRMMLQLEGGEEIRRRCKEDEGFRHCFENGIILKSGLAELVFGVLDKVKKMDYFPHFGLGGRYDYYGAELYSAYFMGKADALLIENKPDEVRQAYREKGYKLSNLTIPLELDKPELFDLYKEQGMDLSKAMVDVKDSDGVKGKGQKNSLFLLAQSPAMVEYLLKEGADPQKAEFALTLAFGRLWHDTNKMKNGRCYGYVRLDDPRPATTEVDQPGGGWKKVDTTDEERTRQMKAVDTIGALLKAGVPDKVVLGHWWVTRLSSIYFDVCKKKLYGEKGLDYRQDQQTETFRRQHAAIFEEKAKADLIQDIIDGAPHLEKFRERLFPEVYDHLVDVLGKARAERKGVPTIASKPSTDAPALQVTERTAGGRLDPDSLAATR